MTMKTKKTLQHIAAVAVVLLTLCLVFATPVAAGSDKTVHDPVAIYSTGTGYGYEKNGLGEDKAIEISTVQDLKNFSAAVNEGQYNSRHYYFKLVNDIDLGNEEWTPIGNDTNGFCGTFDGNGHTISNVKITQYSKNGVGLFGHVEYREGGEKNYPYVDDALVVIRPAIVKGLTVNNIEITSDHKYVGGIAGASTGSILNCNVTGVIKITGASYVGGIVGHVEESPLNGCNVIGESGSYIKGVYKDSSLRGHKVGGLVGYKTVNLNPNFNKWPLVDLSVQGVSVSGAAQVGGLVGYINTDVPVNNCDVSDTSVTLTYYADYVNSLSDSDMATYLTVGIFAGNAASGVTFTDSSAYGSLAVDEGFSNVYDKISVGVIGAVASGVDLSTLTHSLDSESQKKLEAQGLLGDAKIDDTYYLTLAEAVEKATDGQTVTLLKDAEGAGIMIKSAEAKDIVIDFGGNTYTVTSPAVGSPETENQAFHLEKGCIVTLKNGEIVSEGGEVLMLVQNYCDLTLENIILNGANLGDGRYTLSNNNGNVVITGNTQIIAPTDGVAFDVCYYASYPSVSVTFDEKFTGTVTGNIEHTNHKNAEISNYQDNAKLIIKAGTFNGAFSTVNEGANIVITGGTFSSNPSAYIPSGYEVVQPGDKYLVQKYVDRSSSSSSSSTTEPEEPEQPEEPVVEPETPAVPGEVTVETEVTDGGEVELETPAAEGEGGSAAADEDEAKITGVVLPTGTDSEVTFVPVSEQPAPAGQEENTKKVFEINVPSYEKGKAAVIKFTMTVAELAADGKEAADVALWHFDEETGEWTKLVTSYTIVDGVVYFEAITEDFSPFAIIYEDEPAGDIPGDEPQDKPETPESPAPVLGLLAALGAAVVLRRK